VRCIAEHDDGDDDDSRVLVGGGRAGRAASPTADDIALRDVVHVARGCCR